MRPLKNLTAALVLATTDRNRLVHKNLTLRQQRLGEITDFREVETKFAPPA